jgi:hypothetical protein
LDHTSVVPDKVVVAASVAGTAKARNIVESLALIVELRVVKRIDCAEKNIGAQTPLDLCTFGNANELPPDEEYKNAEGGQRRLLAALGVEPEFPADR